MDISFIISSFNQKERLYFSLQSAYTQEGDFEYEVILADDHSDDGTLDMVKELYPQTIVSFNDKPEEKTYTLGDNWNAAASKATGKRLVFSNADVIFAKQFLASHSDPVMQDGIIFGPGYLSAPQTVKLLKECDQVSDLHRKLQENNLIGPDRHAERSADTYNMEWEWDKPYGYNFSVLKEHFDGVGGFPSLKKWGGEETQLCKKIVEAYKVPVKSNRNAYAVHLWHPIVNHENTDVRDDDIRF